MTGESDSTPRRRPPTIDLTATEVETERPAAEPGHEESPAHGSAGPDEPEERVSGGPGGRMQPHALIGAAIGALVMAAILVGLWLAGVVPAPNGLLTGTNNTASGISAQLDKIQAELQAQPPRASAGVAADGGRSANQGAGRLAGCPQPPA